MKLSALVAQYVAYKQSMGMRFHTEDRTLRSFCRAMGEVSVAEIAPDQVHAYIAGTGPVTRSGTANTKCSAASTVLR
jgi:integrase/recombinase XerD